MSVRGLYVCGKGWGLSEEGEGGGAAKRSNATKKNKKRRRWRKERKKNANQNIASTHFTPPLHS